MNLRVTRNCIPNLLTLSRFLFGAFSAISYLLSIILSDWKIFLVYLSLGLLIFSIFTDWLDGYLARKWGCESNFGKIYDPLADKLIVSTFLISFSFSYVVHWLIPFFSVLREIIAERIRYKLKQIGVYLAAIKSAKYKTALQFLVITITLLSSIWISSPSLMSILFIPSLLLSFQSLSKYFSKYWEYF